MAILQNKNDHSAHFGSRRVKNESRHSETKKPTGATRTSIVARVINPYFIMVRGYSTRQQSKLCSSYRPFALEIYGKNRRCLI